RARRRWPPVRRTCGPAWRDSRPTRGRRFWPARRIVRTAGCRRRWRSPRPTDSDCAETASWAMSSLLCRRPSLAERTGQTCFILTTIPDVLPGDAVSTRLGPAAPSLPGDSRRRPAGRASGTWQTRAMAPQWIDKEDEDRVGGSTGLWAGRGGRADRLGQERPGARTGPELRRGNRQLRLPAAVPRTGHRHRQDPAGPAPGRAPPPVRY